MKTCGFHTILAVLMTHKYKYLRNTFAFLIINLELNYCSKDCCDVTLGGEVIIRHQKAQNVVKTTSFSLQAEFCSACEGHDSGNR